MREKTGNFKNASQRLSVASDRCFLIQLQLTGGLVEHGKEPRLGENEGIRQEQTTALLRRVSEPTY